MINKIKDWLYWNAPVITTRKKRQKYAEEHSTDILSYDKVLNCYFIKGILDELKELRNNTWDLERVDFVSEQLKSYFEVKDENN